MEFLQSPDLRVELLGSKAMCLQLDIAKLVSKVVLQSTNINCTLSAMFKRDKLFTVRISTPSIFIANIVPSLPFKSLFYKLKNICS